MKGVDILPHMQLKSDIIFMDYIDIIRTPWIGVCKFILDNKDVFENFFYLENIPNTADKVKAWSVIRNNVNPLYSFTKDDFDLDAMLIDIMNDIDDLYDSDETKCDMAHFVDAMSALPTTKAVYIYTPYYDSRIEYDLHEHFRYGAIQYVYGEFFDVIQEVKPNTIFLNDISKVEALVTDNIELIKGSTLLVTKHLYNFIFNEETSILDANLPEEMDEKYLESQDIELNYFSSLTLGSKMFTKNMLFDDTFEAPDEKEEIDTDDEYFDVDLENEMEENSEDDFVYEEPPETLEELLNSRKNSAHAFSKDLVFTKPDDGDEISFIKFLPETDDDDIIVEDGTRSSVEMTHTFSEEEDDGENIWED